MIYTQIVSLPVLIENICLEDVDLSELFASVNLQFRSILVLTGEDNSSALANAVVTRNRNRIQFDVRKGILAKKEVADSLRQEVEKNNYDLIMGIGGGRVLDTAKYVASRASLNYLAVPTVVSNDGLASPISILMADGASRSYSAAPPMGVLIDRETIKQANPQFVYSGIGDIISNTSALLDWRLAIDKKKERASSFAKLLSEAAVSNLIELEVRPGSDQFIDTYITSTILCGLAMNISGNSRPCSGAEHLISHVLTKFGLSDYSHGLQVGGLTAFILWLHGQERRTYYRFIKSHGYQYRIEDLLNKPFELADIFTEARIVRGDRYTILNERSNEELCSEYAEFLDFMDSL